MAVLRRITPANPISSMPAQVTPGPSVFGVLADGAEAWARELDPLASEVARREGAEAGTAAAGNYQPGTLGGNPGVPSFRGPSGSSRAPALSPDELDPRNGFLPTSGAAPGFQIPIEGAIQGVNPQIVNYAQQAWSLAMPEGSRIVVTTGVSGHSENHRARNGGGLAIDYRVERPDGSVVAWNDPEALRAAEFGAAIGVLGTGAGPTYMGGTHFHWDINATNGFRQWSDDDGGAADAGPGAAQWGARLNAAREMGLAGLLNAAGVPYTPPSAPLDGEILDPSVGSSEPVTQIRTAEGGLETRPIDIFTSRYDIIRENAALGAYTAGVLNNAQLALGDLRRQYSLDPAGFDQAATGYVQQLISNAPSVIREQIGTDLRNEAARQFNGIRDDQYRNTLATANAEARARTELLTDEYTSLVAAGDTEGAAAVRGQLQEVLRYRGSLPQSTLGEAQQEMILAGADRQAESERATQAANRDREAGAILTDIRRAAADGRIHEAEARLNEEAFQNHEDFDRTIGSLNLRDFRPDFARLSPEQRAAMIAEERARPVSEAWETGFLEGMEATHVAALERERNDPVSAMLHNGFDGGTIDPSDPQSMAITLGQRADLAQFMIEQGFTETPRFFTNAERDAFSLMIGPDADPVERAAFAGMLIQALGPEAATAALEAGFEQSSADFIDLAQRTGSYGTLQRGLQGAMLRRAGQARTAPPDVREADAVRDLIESASNVPGVQERFMEMALDYVAFGEGMADVTERELIEAVQLVMGQTTSGGGVAQVFGSQTLLPPNMTADAMERTIRSNYTLRDATRIRPTDDGRFELLSEPTYGDGRVEARTGVEPEQEVIGTYDTLLEALTPSFDQVQGAPMIGDQVLEARDLRSISFQSFVHNGDVVPGVYTAHGNGWDVTDADGLIYLFNMGE